MKSIESGKQFSKVDLSDDWTEFDEEKNVCLQVSELKWSFIRI